MTALAQNNPYKSPSQPVIILDIDRLEYGCFVLTFSNGGYRFQIKPMEYIKQDLAMFAKDRKIKASLYSKDDTYPQEVTSRIRGLLKAAQRAMNPFIKELRLN